MSKNTDLGNLVNGLFVSSTKNVGIGTTTPRAKLDVIGNVYSDSSFWVGDNNGLFIGDLTSGASYAYITGVGSTGASSNLSFSTNGGEKLRITSAGNVGIGTSSPNSRLEVVQSGNAALTVRQSSTAANGTFAQVVLTQGSTYFGANDRSYQLVSNGLSTGQADFAVQYWNGSTYNQRMLITSAGNVGIGTSSPTTKLHVYEALTNSTSYLTIQNNRARNAAVFTQTTNGGFYAGTSIGTDIFNYQIYDAVAGAARITITSGGNVFVGTPSASNSGGLTLAVGNSSGGAISCQDTDGSKLEMQSFGGISYFGTTTNSPIIIFTNGAEVARYTAGGNILIGTTSDNGYKLRVEGNIYASSNIFSNSSIYAVGGIGSQGGIVIDYGYAYGINSNTQVAANAWYMQVSSAWSNNFRFFHGGTGVGQGSARAQIDTSGNYSALSDRNKKKDIVITALGLNEVLQLKPSTFKFIDDENQEEQIGFIAQEIKDIIPHAYYEDKEGDDRFIGLKYNAIIPVLVKAIQELSAEVQLLKNK